MKLVAWLLMFPLYGIAQLESYADSLMQSITPQSPGSLLLIAQNGTPLIKKAYGLANLELNVPADTSQLFGLASVSKQMVAIAILQLASKGQLKLTDDIRKYLPYNTHGKTITIEQLLTHTSGLYSETGATGAKGKTLFDLGLSLGILSDHEFLSYAMQHPLYFEPGTDWGYNAYGFFLCFFIVEKVTGMPFNEYMKKHVFEPAGMFRTCTKADGNRLGYYGTKGLVSNFYYRDVDGKWIWRDVRRLTLFHFYERYAVITCLNDLLQWHLALVQGKLLPKEWLDNAWSAHQLKDGTNTNYGLGWTVSFVNGYKILTHVGIGNNPICVVHVPDQNIYMVCTNFSGTYEQAELILKKLLCKLLPITYPAPEPANGDLKDYTGVYRVYRMGLRTTPQLSDIPVYINVTTSGDTLYMQQTAAEKTWLRPAGKDRFLPATHENAWFLFTRDASGKVNAVINTGTLWTYGPDVQNKKVNRPWRTAPPSITVDSNRLKQYAGTYYLPSLNIFRFITSKGDKLYHRIQGNSQELIPVANNRFVVKGIEDISYTFRQQPGAAATLTISGLRPIDFRKVQ